MGFTLYKPHKGEDEVALAFLPEIERAVKDTAGKKGYKWVTPGLVLSFFSAETNLTLSPLYKIYKTESDLCRAVAKLPGDQAKGLSFGRGDRGHGCGPGQVDNRAHKEHVESGEWRDLYKHVCYLVEKVIIPNYVYIKRKATGFYPVLSQDFLIAISISGYNCGPGNAWKGFYGNHNSDIRTHNKHYSRNVVALWRGHPDWEGWESFCHKNRDIK